MFQILTEERMEGIVLSMVMAAEAAALYMIISRSERKLSDRRRRTLPIVIMKRKTDRGKRYRDML